MTNRISKSLVTFHRQFTLGGLDGVQPAGTYEVEVDEEQIQGLSFLAYRRVATLFHLPAVAARAGWEQVVAIDAEDLKVAQDKDAQA